MQYIEAQFIHLETVWTAALQRWHTSAAFLSGTGLEGAREQGGCLRYDLLRSSVADLDLGP